MFTDTFQINGLPSIQRADGIWILSPYSQKVIRFDKFKKTIVSQILSKQHQGTPYPFGPIYDANKAHITLILTNKCNLQCKYCSVSLKSLPEIMEKKILISAIDYIFQNFKQKELVISFFGGEPTLAFELIKFACELINQMAEKYDKKVKFSLTTNGFFDKKVANILCNYNFSMLFSIDGDEEIQNLQRPCLTGKESYDVVKKNLGYLLKKGLDITASVTMTSFSTPKWKNIIKDLAQSGVKHIQLDPVFPFPWSWATQNSDSRFERPSVDDYVKAVLSAFIEGRKIGIVCSNPVFARLFRPAHFYCDLQAGHQAIAFNYNGDILCCAEVQDSQHPLYNEIKIGSYDHLLKRFIMKATGAQKKRIVKSSCANCFALFHCCGGCQIRNQILIKNIHSNDIDEFTCNMFKELLANYIDMMVSEVINSEQAFKRKL